MRNLDSRALCFVFSLSRDVINGIFDVPEETGKPVPILNQAVELSLFFCTGWNSITMSGTLNI